MFKFFLSLLLSITHFSSNQIINIKNTSNNKWYVVNDDVMGGISKGNISYINNTLIFKGKISLDNNGGFSSIRKYPKNIFVNKKNKIILNIKGDGKTYYLRIKSKINDYYSYTIPFTTTSNWQIISLKLADFYPTFRGRKLNMDNFNKTTIEEIGILIGNKKNEEFKIEIKEILIN